MIKLFQKQPSIKQIGMPPLGIVLINETTPSLSIILMMALRQPDSIARASNQSSAN